MRTHRRPMLSLARTVVIMWAFLGIATISARASDAPARVVGNVVIYDDPKFYSTFPSIVRRKDGELLVAFRRAPERRRFGEAGPTHTDANSYLMLVRSKDDGRTWTKEPQLLYAHPFGGSQDPCMVQLKDGTILCTSYAWAKMTPDAIARMKQPIARSGAFVFLGGYIMRSTDAGRTWQGPVIPAPCEGEAHFDIFGDPVPAMNRGAMCEGQDGKLYWAVASNHHDSPAGTAVHLMVSEDQGMTWKYSGAIARDDKAT